jgi:tetratricopeptide (TPR) repeat protein
MKKLITFGFIMISVLTFGQKEVLNVSKYKDCEVNIPIKGIIRFNHEKTDKEAVDKFSGTELVIIETKRDSTIKRFYRGFLRLVQTENGKNIFLEPTESVISLDKKQIVYLLFNAKNHYYYSAKCYDEKNGIKYITTLFCPSKDTLASQYFGTGELALNMKKYELAVKWFERAVKRDTAFCDAWNSLGIAHQNLNDFKKAYYSYLHGAMSNKTNEESWINLHYLMKMSGDTINAIKSLENLIKYAPTNPNGYSELCKYYKEIGESEKAIEVKKRAELKGIKVE